MQQATNSGSYHVKTYLKNKLKVTNKIKFSLLKVFDEHRDHPLNSFCWRVTGNFARAHIFRILQGEPGYIILV